MKIHRLLFEKLVFGKPAHSLRYGGSASGAMETRIFRYPISIRFEETTSNRHASVVRWTYSQRNTHKKRLLLTFSSQKHI